jgi:hypothetical protein
MLLARVEVDASTSSVAARINNWNAVDGTDLIIAFPVCEERVHQLDLSRFFPFTSLSRLLPRVPLPQFFDG